jgi:hypothetical protein
MLEGRSRRNRGPTVTERRAAEEAAAAAARPKRSRKPVIQKVPYSVLSGEFYDISIPTYTNKFGEKYIKCIWENGINIPLSKHIDELNDIITNSKDDKSDKRIKRLNFLKMCYKINNLKEIFILFSNLLNGGGSNDSELYKEFPLITESCQFKQYRDSQKLVLTCAGGNIITIFAQFVYIIWDNEFEKIGEINKFILNYYASKLNTTGTLILDSIKEEIINEIDKEIVEELANKSYSDFDFKITPNKIVDKSIITNYEANTTANLPLALKRSNDTEGFLLLRSKSAMNCMSTKVKNYKTENTGLDCDQAKAKNKSDDGELPDADDNLLLVPQTIQKNFFSKEWLQDNFILPKDLQEEESDKVDEILEEFEKLFIGDDSFEEKFERLKEEIASEIDKEEGNENFQNFLRCFSHLLNLYKKKLEIGRQTQVNVNTILSIVGKKDKFSSEDLIVKYEIIINYLYGITQCLNKFIELNMEEFDEKDNINESYFNITTLLLLKDGNPNKVARFMAKVLQYLVTDPIFENKQILKKLQSCYVPDPPCKYLQPSNPKIYSYLSQKTKEPTQTEKLERESLNELYNLLNKRFNEIPNGLRIVINVIKQNNRELIAVNEKELDKILSNWVMEGIDEKNIDTNMGTYSDEELLAGVPEDVVEKLAAELGYKCLTPEETPEEIARREREETKEEVDAADEEEENSGKKQRRGGGKFKKPKKTKKLKKDKKTKKLIRKNKKTKKIKKNKKKNLKKSRKYRKKLENN